MFTLRYPSSVTSTTNSGFPLIIIEKRGREREREKGYSDFVNGCCRGQEAAIILAETTKTD